MGITVTVGIKSSALPGYIATQQDTVIFIVTGHPGIVLALIISGMSVPEALISEASALWKFAKLTSASLAGIPVSAAPCQFAGFSAKTLKAESITTLAIINSLTARGVVFAPRDPVLNAR